MKTIYLNGQVFTGSLPLQEAFAVENGHFLAVGTNKEITSLSHAEDTVVDLEGRFVCPGFNDSHMHLLNYGNALEQCDLSRCTGSVRELQEGLRTFLREQALPKGTWLRGRGWNQDYFSPASGMPTRFDLDAVSTEHPICIVRCCGHCLVVNSRALELLSLDKNLPQVEGGSFDVDEAGNLTGVFCDSAMSYVYTRLPAPSREDLKRMIRTASRELNRRGITSCHSDDLCCFENVPWTEVIAAYRELEDAGELTVRVYEQSQFTTPEGLQEFLDQGYNTGTGSDFFRIGPLKMLGDGSLGARTAYLSRGYADAPEERGIPIFSQQEFDDMILLAHQNSMQVAIHAIGDGILDRILSAYERAFTVCPRKDHRSGVVHVQLTRPEQLEKMAALNLHAYIQTIFLDYDTRIVRDRAGEPLASTSYAFHSMGSLGISRSNGTDCPVEYPDPMRGIQCAVTRQPLDGSLSPYRPEEAMTVEEALSLYTAGSAYASFEELKKGRIQPGFLADFAVFSENPFDTAPQHIAAIQAKAAYVGGKRIFACVS